MIETCPACSTDVSNNILHCPECGEPLIRVRTQSRTQTRPPPEPKPYDADRGELSQFGISSLLWLMAAIAVMLAIGRASPEAACAVALFVVPIMIRGMVTISREQVMGGRLPLSEVAYHFFAAAGLFISQALASGVVFVCFGMCMLPFTLLRAPGWGPAMIVLGVSMAFQIAFSVGFILWLWNNREPMHNRLGDVGFYAAWVTVAAAAIGMIAPMRLEPEFAYQFFVQDVPGWGVVSIVLSLFGFVCSLIAVFWRPRLLACAGLGLSATHIAVMLTILALVQTAIAANTPAWKFSLLPTVYSIYFASFAVVPAITFGVYFVWLRRG